MELRDVECPYCESWQEINHDDGVGYEEDVLHQQECRDCNKVFTFSTGIIYCYTAYKADCLNGEEHQWRKTNTYPRQFSKWECEICEKTRPLSAQEMLEAMQDKGTARPLA